MEKIPVKGHSNLYRDVRSGAIVNTSSSDYDSYISLRQSKEKENQKIQNFKEELDNMKDDINEIKFLLKELINGSRQN
jgi:hypothetical protein